jgi:hypothetical protein
MGTFNFKEIFIKLTKIEKKLFSIIEKILIKREQYLNNMTYNLYIDHPNSILNWGRGKINIYHKNDFLSIDMKNVNIDLL